MTIITDEESKSRPHEPCDMIAMTLDSQINGPDVAVAIWQKVMSIF